VLLLTSAPTTFDRDAWVGLYEGGPTAAITTDSALACWGVPGFSQRPIHIGHERNRTTASLEGVVWHESRFWPDDHRMLLNGMPIVTPTRALFDLANANDVNPQRVERAINNAWARRLTSGELLQKMLDEWCKRGRRGSAFLREYLAARPIDWQTPESNLERRFVELIVKAGMPEPKRQRNIGDDASWIGRIDMCDPELPLLGEIDSDLFHTAPLDASADAERDDRLTAAGFRVERFPERQIWYEPGTVVERWRRARHETRTGAVS
jgi:very-short-patch-repair endonuclease